MAFGASKTLVFCHRKLRKRDKTQGFGPAKAAKPRTGRLQTVFFSSWSLVAAPGHRFPRAVWLLGARPLANTALGVVFEPTPQKHYVLAIGRRKHTVKSQETVAKQRVREGRHRRLRCCCPLLLQMGSDVFFFIFSTPPNLAQGRSKRVFQLLVAPRRPGPSKTSCGLALGRPTPRKHCPRRRLRAGSSKNTRFWPSEVRKNTIKHEVLD